MLYHISDIPNCFSTYAFMTQMFSYTLGKIIIFLNLKMHCPLKCGLENKFLQYEFNKISRIYFALNSI